MIHNLKTTWSTKLSMSFLSSLDNLLSDANVTVQKGVDNFETEHKTCYFLVRGCSSLTFFILSSIFENFDPSAKTGLLLVEIFKNMAYQAISAFVIKIQFCSPGQCFLPKK